MYEEHNGTDPLCCNKPATKALMGPDDIVFVYSRHVKSVCLCRLTCITLIL